MNEERRAAPYLLCRVRTYLCALPVAHVAETMRPLPVLRVEGAPAFVLGMAVVRGLPAPVVDLAFLLAGEPGQPGRFVALRTGGRLVALAVDATPGIVDLPPRALATLPPLLSDTGAVSALATLDAQLVFVLNSGRLVPEAVWSGLGPADAAS